MSEDHDHDPALVEFLRENYRMKTWIAGFIAKCPACIQEATEWANLLGLSHADRKPDSDTDTEITV